jgi:hypothetical protein
MAKARARGGQRREGSRVRITVDVFSGRENPTIELTGRQAQQVLESLRPDRQTLRREVGVPPVPTLGYRGLLVEVEGARIAGFPSTFRVADGVAHGPEFSIPIADPSFEEFVIGAIPRTFPVAEIRAQLGAYRQLLAFWRKWWWKDWCCTKRRKRCRCAPLYEPQWWNVPARQPVNNCYNYACNYRSDTFAQPGLAAGAMYTALTCAAVRPAAIADALIDAPSADNRCPKEGHLVALVVWPNGDFHWYRKGRDGMWSHKPGGTAVTNLDNSGNPISDPRTADRGPYTDFCTFMVVMHGHIKIN